MTPAEMFPRSTSVGLHFVEQWDRKVEPPKFMGSLPGYDWDAVFNMLGPRDFEALASGLKRVFCCDHRRWPMTHPDANKRGSEVWCIYAEDLEAFLARKGISLCT